MKKNTLASYYFEINSVEDLINHNYRYSPRPYTALEIEMKLKSIKSKDAIYREIKRLLKRNFMRKEEIEVEKFRICFYIKIARKL